MAQYRADGKSRKASFGDARVVSQSKAREAARQFLAKVALGYDPQAERAAKRRAAELTFAKVRRPIYPLDLSNQPFPAVSRKP